MQMSVCYVVCSYAQSHYYRHVLSQSLLFTKDCEVAYTGAMKQMSTEIHMALIFIILV